MKQAEKNSKPIGWNLTIDSKEQLYRIAAFLRVKRSHTVLRIIDMLFTELSKDKDFKDFVGAYDKLLDVTKDRSTYTSFYIPLDYMEKFEDMMYSFGYIDRSPFLRMIINYVYNKLVKPINEEILPKVKADIEKLGYQIIGLGPILNGDIYIHLQNPTKQPAPRTKTTPRTKPDTGTKPKSRAKPRK